MLSRVIRILTTGGKFRRRQIHLDGRQPSASTVPAPSSKDRKPPAGPPAGDTGSNNEGPRGGYRDIEQRKELRTVAMLEITDMIGIDCLDHTLNPTTRSGRSFATLSRLGDIGCSASRPSWHADGTTVDGESFIGDEDMKAELVTSQLRTGGAFALDVEAETGMFEQSESFD
ncbi:hypothetical protein BJ508DRAFT_372499 [Ascobolus immersus RN42]|uniref:Uncharacterized protein n=1 Tax=Ascobolus immersus RN42 TaxID=1160509 RepID=A0A3N4IMV6_ASCIM|nr:hypothetical protein BJ508DRAFT_372499 [Ascobolus immersus RN42]